MSVRLLDTSQSYNKITRIAYQIYEKNYFSDTLTLVGIDKKGSFIANELLNKLNNITKKKINYIENYAEIGNINNKQITNIIENIDIILIDDVLYSGTTLFNAALVFAKLKPKTIQVAVLIDRGHRKMPISADYVGIDLATTLQEYIRVEIDESQKTINAYLEF